MLIRPAVNVAPKIAVAPSSGFLAMLTMGPTAAKETAMMTGNRMPKGPRPIDWMQLAMPQQSRSELIRYAT